MTMSVSVRRRFVTVAWVSVALALLSAVPWLLFVAQSISAEPISSVISQRIFLTVVTSTQFGHAWIIGTGILVALLPFTVKLGRNRTLDATGVVLAATGLATIAWQGHAGAEEGVE